MGRSSRERTAKAARACPAVRGGRRCAPGGTPARSTGQRRGERLRACVARGRGRGGRDRSYRSPASARPAAAYTTSPGDTWLGKEVILLSPPPRRTVRTSHLVHGSSNLRTPRGA